MKIPPFKIDEYIGKIADEKIAGCLVYGPEASLVNYRFNLIAKKIAPDLTDPFLVSDINKDRLSESKSLLVDEFFSFSMMGGRKLIMAKNIDALIGPSIKGLFEDADYASKSDNFILIQGGDLDKSSILRKSCENNANFATIACYEDNEVVIKRFIFEELNKREVKFDRNVVDLFLEKFGKNRQIILSEIEKILAFLGDDKNLEIELVERLTASESDISANEFVMSFASKKYNISLTQLEKLFRNNVEPIMLMRFLSNYFQKLYNAKAQISSGKCNFDEAVKNQRLFFKVEDAFKEHLKSSSLKNLIRKLQIFEELESKMKSGQMPPRLLMTNFIQKFL